MDVEKPDFLQYVGMDAEKPDFRGFVEWQSKAGLFRRLRRAVTLFRTDSAIGASLSGFPAKRKET